MSGPAVSVCVEWTEAGVPLATEIPLPPQGQDGAAEGGPFRAEFRTTNEHGFLLLDLALQLDASAAAVRLRRLRWRITGWVGAATHAWLMRGDAWGKPRVMPIGEADGEAFWRIGLLDARSGRGSVCVYRLPAQWEHRLTVSGGDVACESIVDADLAPGATWREDTLAMAADTDVATRLSGPPSFRVSRHAAGAAREHGAWNSWDYHKHGVNLEVVRENMRAICADPVLSSFVRYIVIDDGWQDLDGEWETHPERFPCGMRAVADEIRAAGFLPGMWSAPFMVDCHSRIFREHPEWFVQRDGAPFSPYLDVGCTGVWGDRYYLDPTHPGVREHVYRMYDKFYGWGFRYFKTDFLVNPYRATLNAPEPDREGRVQLHDGSRGILGPHRECMEAIRAAIRDDSFWLGCGSSWATGAGLMDASRTGGDISIWWDNVKICANSAIYYGHLHGSLLLTDPDFLVVRGRETSRPGMMDVPPDGKIPYDPAKHHTGPTLLLDEARVWATCVILSGGLVTLSDRIAGLNEAGLEIVRRVCELAGGPAARPLEFDRPLPRAVLRGGPSPLLGCFNWEDSPAPALPGEFLPRVPAGRWRDVWTGVERMAEEWAGFRQPPHACLLLRPAG